MSIPVSLTLAAMLLTLASSAQAQQNRRFTALAQPSLAVQRSVASPAGASRDRARREFGSFSAASVAHTLGY